MEYEKIFLKGALPNPELPTPKTKKETKTKPIVGKPIKPIQIPNKKKINEISPIISNPKVDTKLML